jgi:glutamate-5-semialdehyde dehydrogenase
MTTFEIMCAVKSASKFVACASTEEKNRALKFIADSIEKATDSILLANEKDMQSAKGVISDVMLDRLMLNADRIKSMADGIRHVITLDDPVGRVISSYIRDDGLEIKKMSSAIGVVAIIYESRPNVTSDAAALALKSGNACVLRCGKEAHASAAAITRAIGDGLVLAGFPREAVMLVEDTSRESARELMCGNGYVDLLIPRGGPGLIKACVENATVPCIETGTGICHIYVDKCADLDMAVKITRLLHIKVV